MLKNFLAYQEAVQFYKTAEKLRVPVHLRDQLSRAASSIALNLAEGSERGSVADQRRFYRFAMSSLRECQAVIDLLADSEAALEIKKRGDHLAALIFKLIKSLESNSFFNSNG